MTADTQALIARLEAATGPVGLLYRVDSAIKIGPQTVFQHRAALTPTQGYCVMADTELLPPALLRKILAYNPETGAFVWLVRTPDTFAPDGQADATTAKKWNARYAGKAAGSINPRGYLQIFINNRRYSGHRLAWAIHYGEWPNQWLDHINHDPSDNRIANLRLVTPRENMRNRPRGSQNTSGVVGVHWSARDKVWSASIHVGPKTIYLGNFREIEAAIAARKAAERELGFHPNHGRAKGDA